MANTPVYTILQWNTRSLIPNKPSLINLINDHNISVCLLSETWLHPSTHLYVPSYNVFRHDRPVGRGGGVAILTHSSFQAQEVRLRTDQLPDHTEAVCVRLRFEEKDISFLSLYIPSQVDLRETHLTSLLQQIPQPVFIGGDFNSHHPLWGSLRSDARSAHILSFLDRQELAVLNSGEATRFTHPTIAPSVVDLSFCSSELHDNFSWRVLPDASGSDHYPLLIDLLLRASNLSFEPASNAPPAYSTGWKIDDEKWHLFSSSLDNIYRLAPNISARPVTFETLHQHVEESANLAFRPRAPLRPPVHGRPFRKKAYPPWWNEECTLAILHRRAAFQVFHALGDQPSYLQARQAVAHAKRTLKAAKRQSWEQYCSTLSSSTTAGAVWRQIAGYRKSWDRIYRNSSPPDWLEEFLIKFSRPSSNPRHPPSSNQFTTASPKFLTCPFSMGELNRVLKSLPDTSPGPDGIPYSFFRHFPVSTKLALLTIYDKVLQSGVIPSAWSSSILVPIPKMGGEPATAAAYRPISRLSCYLKIFERLLKHRLVWWAETLNHIPRYQYGFRKGRNAVDAVVHLQAEVEFGFAYGRTTAVAAVDIQGAYDSVCPYRLYDTLRHLGLPTILARCILHLLTNRVLYAKYRGHFAGPRTSSFGLPQGSSLSPLLFALYTAPLRRLVNEPISYIQFADDFLFYTSDHSLWRARDALQQFLHTLPQLFNTFNFSLSALKTQVCLFSRRRIAYADFNQPLLTFQVDGHTIFASNFLKYLGIILDSKLLWEKHIIYIVNKVEKSLNIIRSLCGVRWGASPTALLLIYRALIRSRLDYGCPAFGGAAPTHLNRLNTIQYRAVRVCLGLMQSTPCASLLVEAGEIPLALRRDELISRYLMKLYANKSHPLIHVLDRLRSSLTRPYWRTRCQPRCLTIGAPLVMNSFNLADYTVPYSIIHTDFTLLIDIHTFAVLKQYALTHPSSDINIPFRGLCQVHYPHFYHWYVDGSRLEIGLTGYGIYSAHVSRSVRTASNLSVYTTELLAIRLALQQAAERPEKSFIIFSDSLSSLMHLRSPVAFNNLSLLVGDILLRLSLLRKRGFEVRLCWIPAHIGISGNECADRLAKLGALQREISDDLPQYDDIRTVLRQHTLQRWATQWERYSSPATTNLGHIVSVPRTQPWFTGVKNSRRFVTTFCRLRTGHTSLPNHLARFRIIANANCRCGASLCDLHHILFICPLYVASRDLLLSQLPHPPPTVLEILKNQTLYTYVFSFLQVHRIQV